MIHNRQKAMPHIYAQAAGLNDPTYRTILRQSASVASCADERMTQTGFDRLMASLETVLFQRVHAGDVRDPRGINRWIHDEFYWRKKLPQTGFINSRRLHEIENLWARLCEFLPDEQAHLPYLMGIARRASGRHVDALENLTLQEAGCLLDALRDRLSYAMRNATVEADSPF